MFRQITVILVKLVFMKLTFWSLCKCGINEALILNIMILVSHYDV